MLRSRDVMFLENSCEGIPMEGIQSKKGFQLENMNFDMPASETSDDDTPEQHNAPDQPEEQPRRSQRATAPPNRLGTITGEWWNHVGLPCAFIPVEDEEPVSIDEALSGSDAKKWKAAADSVDQWLKGEHYHPRGQLTG